MTPLGIEILLHTYCTPNPWGRPSTAASAEFHSLLINGLIEKVEQDAGEYRCTDRGEAHVSQLLSLPWPTQAWIDKDGKVIE